MHSEHTVTILLKYLVFVRFSSSTAKSSWTKQGAVTRLTAVWLPVMLYGNNILVKRVYSQFTLDVSINYVRHTHSTTPLKVVIPCGRFNLLIMV